MKKLGLWIVMTLLGTLLMTGCGGSGGDGTVGSTGGESGDGSPGTVTASLPPDPSTIAPALRSAGITPMIDQVSFLYRSDPPVQSDVDESRIDATVVAVVRGRVLDRDNAPLPGVKITILGHPEFGYTYSRKDGVFDMVVNGGTKVTVNYAKEGYLTLQRTDDVPALDYYVFNDVVMTEYSTKEAVVHLGDLGGPVAVVEGDEITDDRGTRKSTLLFTNDTRASLKLPDGTSRPVRTLHLRSTEYTVGENGPAAMPAELPEGVAYTYCIEFTVEEAEEAGAVSVEFTEPVIHYVENFIGRPIGDVVPTYYYDKYEGRWVTMEPGRVIAIVGETDGKAEIDIDGDGEADDVANLLGISDAERVRLAELYEPGISLWRTPLAHFTPIDHNFPQPPPEDDRRLPDDRDMQDDLDHQNDPEEEPCGADGSIVYVESRILGEAIPLPGTDLSLVYDSSRTTGDRRRSRLSFRLLNTQWSDTLREIRVTVSIAGVSYVTSYERFEPYMRYRFDWDGLDAYGRKPVGDILAHVEVEYIYQAPDGYPSGAASRSVVILQEPSVVKVGPFYSFRRKSFTTTLRSRPVMPLGLEGWALSKHHQFDVVRGVVLYGDGHRDRVGGTLDTAWSVILGGGEENGSVSCDGMDGSDAEELALASKLDHVGLDADGNLYLLHECGVLEVTTNGIVHLKIGIDELTARWDSILASEPMEKLPLAVTKDGTLFFATYSQIIRIGADGSADLYAGSEDGGPILASLTLRGTDDADGDGGPAVDARLENIRSIAVSEDGLLYVVESRRIRKIEENGIISTVVDDLNVEDVRIDEDGSVYILVRNYPEAEIRKLLHDGRSEVVAVLPYGEIAKFTVLERRVFGVAWVERKLEGNRILYGTFDADTSSFHIVTTRTVGTDEDGDGDETGQILKGPQGYYLVDPFEGEVLFWHLGNGSNDVGQAVYTRDLREKFEFDPMYGRHLATYDALKGLKTATFQYDDEGKLTGYTDRFGNAVRIGYDADGVASMLKLPHGKEVSLAHEGRSLTSLRTPAGYAWRFSYADGGLLREIVKPNDHRSGYEYDEEGALVRVTNPAGAETLLRADPSEGTDFITVERSGRETLAYSVDRFPKLVETNEKVDGIPVMKQVGTVTQRRVQMESGEALIEVNGTIDSENSLFSTSFAMSDGTVSRSVSRQGESLFDRSFFIPYRAEVKTPSGLVRTTETSRVYELGNEADPTTLESYTQTVTLNAKVYVSVYERHARSKRTTSPEGRTIVKTYNEKGVLQSIRYADDLPLIFDYDEEGRVTKIGWEDAPYLVAYGSDGDTFTVTDPFGYRSSVLLQDGKIVEKRLADGTAVAYGYDGYGSLISVTGPGGARYTMAYDANDRMTRFTPPAASGTDETVRFSRSPDKKLTAILYSDGSEARAEYDETGRRQRFAHISYEYDRFGKLTGVATEGGVHVALGYDGFLPKSQVYSGEVEGNVVIGYDENFWPVSVSVDGEEISKTYDDDGFLTRTGDLILSRRDVDGRIAFTQLDGLLTRSEYDERGELRLYDAGDLLRFRYTRDALGRITEVNETIESVSVVRRYTYDARGRLSEVFENGERVSFHTYDETGCRVDASCDLQGRVTAKDDTSFGYDAAGRRAYRQQNGIRTEYRYNALGDLTGVTLPDGTDIAYLLDGFHRRVAKEVNGTRRWSLLYKDGLNPVAQLDGEGHVVARFVYGEKKSVPAYMIKGGEKYRLLSDHLGSVRLVVKLSDGSVSQRIDYDVWGNVIHDSNPGFQPFGFAGGLYDPDSRLVHFGAREYDPSTGSWISRDPLLFKKGAFNLYVYAGNDPVNRTDAAGMSWRNMVSAANSVLDFFNNLLGLAEDVENVADAATQAENAENTFEDHLMTEDDEVNEQAYELYNERRNSLANLARACATLARDLNDFLGNLF